MSTLRLTALALAISCLSPALLVADDTTKRPNIIFIMSDDHASHAMSCYGSRINQTPNLDRIAKDGVKFVNAFCTNSICSPCRAVVFTGKYSHVNGVLDNRDIFDGAQPTVPSILRAAGYQTAMIGKWHLHSDPIGFDYWKILPGQGKYHDPDFIEMGKRFTQPGYVTDIIGEDTINWIRNRDPDKPFCVFSHHKAPHRLWQPHERHKKLFAGKEFPEPETFDDDYKTRSIAAQEQEMTVEFDLDESDLKEAPPEGLTGEALKKWKYNRYMQDYLGCIASVDENVGKLLDYLDESDLAEDTIVIYTSDQGFFLGDHGWYDKRFMYEESYRMPLIARFPKEIKAATTVDAMVLNLDIAPTLLDYAGLEIPAAIQGRSFRPMLKGEEIGDWRKSAYYHYYEYPAWHMVKRHYGVRTDRYKLIHFYYDIDAWELYDLKNDPHELNNIYDVPANQELIKELKAEIVRLQKKYGDSPELAQEILKKDLEDPQKRERVRKKAEERKAKEMKAAETKAEPADAMP
jgi:arylsulfatase A-like enzyme